MIHFTRRLLKRSLISIPLILVPLFVICIIRYHLYFSNPEQETRCEDNKQHQPITDRTGLVNRFAQALRFQTISRNVGDFNADELVKLINWLRQSYPTIHNSKLVRQEIVANYSLLYTIQGSDTSLKPYMLCAHLDVVPVELDKWTVDPFGGVVKDDYIYGRGTIDLKDLLLAIFESLEHFYHHLIITADQAKLTNKRIVKDEL